MEGSTSGLNIVTDKFDPVSESECKMASSPVNTSAILFPFLNYVLYALHIVYEVRRTAKWFLNLRLLLLMFELWTRVRLPFLTSALI